MTMTSKSKVQVAGELRPGWADLPRDLLESVLDRLPVPDCLRFPAVCTAWQSAATTARPQDPPTVPPSPWLMLPFNPTKSLSSEALRFLSLTEPGGRTYAIRQPAPGASDRLCIGSSSDGWLVTADAASELHLLNPVTGAQVPLPSVTTLPHVDAADGRYSLLQCCFEADDEVVAIPPETVAADRLRYEVYEKAVVVSPPSCSSAGSGGYAVLLICHPLSRLALARAGDAEWALLDTPGRCWVDAVPSAQRRGVAYAMDAAGRVDAWDLSTATHTPVAPPCRAGCCAMSAACRRYLVELAPGRLLQVHRLRDHNSRWWEPWPERVEYTTKKVELFLFDGGEGGAGQWAPVDGASVLAGRALFLGKNASLCVPAAGLTLKGGCVYFTDDGPWSHDRCREVAPDVGVLDLADGTYRPPRGALRDLLWKWPPPVWVFPSLAT